MGGYYVPEIQRPGFGYKRRGDDEDEFDEDWGGGGGDASGTPDAVSSSGTPASDVSASAPTPSDWQQPSYWPPQTQSFTPYAEGDEFSAPPSSGGAGPAITTTPPDVGSLADNYPSTTGTPGVDSQPMPAPKSLPPPVSTIKPYEPGPQQQKLKEMTAAGPKRSILGTIAGMAAKGAAGYVNAASRTRNPVPVPTQTARDWAFRAPAEYGGGSWDTKLARQTQLAEQEQGEEKRALSTQQIQAQAEERMAQAKERGQYGDYLGEQAQTNREAKEEQARNNKFQRIMQLGGRGSTDLQRVDIPPGGKPPAGDGWYVDANPYKPGYQIAVRPNPGREVTPEEGKKMNIAPDSQGKYYATPVMMKNADQLELGTEREARRMAEADAKAARDETERVRREANDKNTARHQTVMEGIAAGNAEDRTAAKEQQRTDQLNKTLAAAEDEKNKRIVDADRRADAERAKLRQQFFKVPPKDEQRIQQQVKADKLIAYNQYAAISRQWGGRAWDAKGVDDDGNPIQGTEAYGKGETPVPYGTGGPTPTAPAAPTIPATPPEGGRGGRGGVNLPLPVNAAPSQAGGQPPLPPPEAVKNMKPGVPTGFRNGQMWKKEADGSLTYLGQKKNN